MSERDGFLRAIAADPADDTVRLAFADWLDERGDRAEAEFIRFHVEIGRVGHRLEDPHARELVRQRDVRWGGRPHDGFGSATGQDAQGTYPGEYAVVGYRRGLPDRLAIDLGPFLFRGDEWFAAYPTLRELAVFDSVGRVAALAGCPLLGAVDVLELAFWVDPEDARALAASPHLRGVGTLRLWVGWSDALAEAVARHATADWPARVELVQLYGGLAAGADAAAVGEQADERARRANAVAGRELAHVVRPFDRLFPLRGVPPDVGEADDARLGIDLQNNLLVGQLPDGTSAVVGLHHSAGSWVIARFGGDGRLLDAERRPCPVPDFDLLSAGEAARQAGEALGLSPAVVRVHEFEGPPPDRGRFGVHLWPQRYFLADPSGPTPLVGETDLYEWLKREDFVIEWGPDYYADWRGEVHTS